ncbi:hypothetical protein D3C87_1748280 [compost metagenome]
MVAALVNDRGDAEEYGPDHVLIAGRHSPFQFPCHPNLLDNGKTVDNSQRELFDPFPDEGRDEIKGRDGFVPHRIEVL